MRLARDIGEKDEVGRKKVEGNRGGRNRRKVERD
jgi:hypothetical protein